MDSLREPEINLTERLLEQIKDVLNKDGIDVLLKKELKENVDSTKIPFRLVKQVHDELSKSGDGKKKIYLHEMLEGCTLHIPEFESPPRCLPARQEEFQDKASFCSDMVDKRSSSSHHQNPELEARCVKLRLQRDNKRYKNMVKNVDKSQQQEDYFTPGQDVKEMNRQIMSVVNFVVTVLAAFAFGYKATEFTFSGSNVFAFQLGAGLTLGTIVFFADLYFLLRESE